MKQVTATASAVVIGGGASTKFKIKASAKSFRALLNAVYPDKVKAPVRELMTNAFDSHVAAGASERPFDVRLPSRYDPVFSVRDYGVSMDHEDVVSLYVTVFESTKENSNEEVGSWGLGSKSPYAYTDEFTVVCWKNGEKRVYQSYMVDGFPEIALLSREESSEPDGVEVSFAVLDSDVYKFETAFRVIAEGFSVKPKVIGARAGLFAELKPPTPRASGRGWALYDSVRPAVARQGCVVYPIAQDKVDQHLRWLLTPGLVVDFDIGKLDVTISREELSYDDATVKNLNDRLEEVSSDLDSIVASAIISASPWEMITALKRMFDDDIYLLYRKRLTWKGKHVREPKSLRRGARRYSRNGGFCNWSEKSVVGEYAFVVDFDGERASSRQLRIKAALEQEKQSIIFVSGKRRHVLKQIVSMGRPSFKLLSSYAPVKPALEQVKKKKRTYEVINRSGQIEQIEVPPSSGSFAVTTGNCRTAAGVFKKLHQLKLTDVDVVYVYNRSKMPKYMVSSGVKSFHELHDAAVREVADEARSEAVAAALTAKHDVIEAICGQQHRKNRLAIKFNYDVFSPILRNFDAIAAADKLAEGFYAKYPLLRHLNLYNDKSAVREAKKYIALIDDLQERQARLSCSEEE